jgi:hypothetical protein
LVLVLYFRDHSIRTQEIDRHLDPDFAELVSGALAFGDLVVARVIQAIDRDAEAVQQSATPDRS